MIPMAAALALMLARQAVDDQPLGLAELEAYHAALEAGPSGEAVAATFRDLWDRPDAFRGRRVRVEGTIARRFRQGPVGDFPPLTELWVATPDRNLICLVHPDPGEAPPAKAPAEGSKVRFEGTFLKRVRYRGGDVDRLAPLVVGPGPPEVVDTARMLMDRGAWGRIDWMVGVVAAAVVLMALLRVGLHRSGRRPPRNPGPPPEFVDG